MMQNRKKEKNNTKNLNFLIKKQFSTLLKEQKLFRKTENRRRRKKEKKKECTFKKMKKVETNLVKEIDNDESNCEAPKKDQVTQLLFKNMTHFYGKNLKLKTMK